MERETFEFQGVTWFKHTPGDPMPCNGEELVSVLLKAEEEVDLYLARADRWGWGDVGSPGVYTEEDLIIGWRYGDKKA